MNQTVKPSERSAIKLKGLHKDYQTEEEGEYCFGEVIGYLARATNSTLGLIAEFDHHSEVIVNVPNPQAGDFLLLVTSMGLEAHYV